MPLPRVNCSEEFVIRICVGLQSRNPQIPQRPQILPNTPNTPSGRRRAVSLPAAAAAGLQLVNQVSEAVYAGASGGIRSRAASHVNSRCLLFDSGECDSCWIVFPNSVYSTFEHLLRGFWPNSFPSRPPMAQICSQATGEVVHNSPTQRLCFRAPSVNFFVTWIA